MRTVHPVLYSWMVLLPTFKMERLGKQLRSSFHFYICSKKGISSPPALYSPNSNIANLWYSYFELLRYPKLGTQHPESNSAGNDVFAKFSAFIKNTKKDANESESLPSSCFLFSAWTSIPPLVWFLLRSGRDLCIEIREKYLLLWACTWVSGTECFSRDYPEKDIFRRRSSPPVIPCSPMEFRVNEPSIDASFIIWFP